MGQAQVTRLKQLHDLRYESQIEFSINGKPYIVSNEQLSANTSLNEFIREHAHLKGTKFMCLEGGCGACIVSVQSQQSSGNTHSYSVNSCLIPVFACHGWAITTIEGLGSGASGYHNLQKRLAAASGSQCGYCSPGMVMNMHSLMESNPTMSMEDIENSFGGNICRCTGYRPILDAFKSFAVDAPNHLVNKLKDIEDLHFPKPTKTCDGTSCGNKCGTIVCPPKAPKTRVFLNLKGGESWYRPVAVKEIFELFDMIGDASYQFVVGNTGHGVYRVYDAPQVFIDLNGVGELATTSVSSNSLVLGANVSLTEAMEMFRKVSKDRPSAYGYCDVLADHIDLIANVPVRNVGSLAGNLSLKHQHPEFPSDIFLILETVGAQLTIADCSGMQTTVGVKDWLSTSMQKKLIVNVMMKPLDNSYILKTFKIMPRAQNAHAHVNAGFLFKVDRGNGFQILEQPTIVFGGINPSFVHASSTEEYFSGKPLMDNGTLQGALKILEKELDPNQVLPDPSPDYRKGLALSLLYKFTLLADPDKVEERVKSGGPILKRSVSTGKQDFDSDRSQWPLNQPVPKLEGLMQCSGEAEYTNDIPQFKEEVWAQLVLCDRAMATIKNVDTSEAMKMPGVMAYFDAKDIPGQNMYNPIPGNKQDPVFVEGTTNYAGQAVGVIIADTHMNAIEAAKKVKINYSKMGMPVCEVEEVVTKKMTNRINEFAAVAPTKKKGDAKFKLKGKWDLKSQYHFTMETLTCVAVPKENQLDIYVPSQYPTALQKVVSSALNIPLNRIDVTVRRLGGGYGIKVDRPNHTSIVCGLAATLLHRPVRMVVNLENCMEWSGKRLPNYCEYEVGVNDNGEIQYLDANMYQGNGHLPNAFMANYSIGHLDNGYDPSTFNVKMFGVITDTPWNTWCRAPGSTECISMMENIMEHIANVVDKDPISVRLANLQKGSPIPGMIEDAKNIADYDRRMASIEEFNQNNRWKKRGMNLSSMGYPFHFWAHFFANVSIYSGDGSVAISHGGIEMGQGINTKAAQVAAKFLGVDLSMVTVKPVTTFENPNNSPTGGCQGSDCVCYAVMMSCQELNRRLAPVRAKLGKKASWVDVVQAADAEAINLRHSYLFTPKDNVKSYMIYGVAITEVEVDVLTGQFMVRRVDLLEDAGQSISPEVDIGQVEGAFVMGMGYFTSEETVHNLETGALMTNRTWNYKPPGARDIPEDFRVTLRKKSNNPMGTLGSKATGEPPFCLSCTVPLAIRNAIESSRSDSGLNESWFEMSTPYTTERIWMACQNDPQKYTI
uniref:Xanthine dehydrogenase n=2 Tax=Lygus hesperus TaxID=30085 RepID=A0A0K8S633_LYGHE